MPKHVCNCVLNPVAVIKVNFTWTPPRQEKPPVKVPVNINERVADGRQKAYVGVADGDLLIVYFGYIRLV